MAKFAHLKGTDFMVNLDLVESLSKTRNSGKSAIVFNYRSGRSDLWLFESEAALDTAFTQLRAGTESEFLVE